MDFYITFLPEDFSVLIKFSISSVDVERCMKKLKLELQKILGNDIELTISELTYFEC